MIPYGGYEFIHRCFCDILAYSSIALNDGVDTIRSENEMMILKNVFNDWYSRDTSKKVRSVMQAKGKSGNPLATNPPYGYKKSEDDKNKWVIDEETAPIVQRIFKLCIEGLGPSKIAGILSSEGVLIPTAYIQSKKAGTWKFKYPTRWGTETVAGILERQEHLGCTVNFKTHVKSYSCKKRIDNPKEDWLIIPNTHEPIISQHDFDIVQEIRRNKRRPQRHGEINLFSLYIRVKFSSFVNSKRKNFLKREHFNFFFGWFHEKCDYKAVYMLKNMCYSKFMKI